MTANEPAPPTIQVVKIISIEQVTHDVKKFQVEKPAGYTFSPGQTTEVSINTQEWRDQKRPFTFTCLNTDPYLEFIIKIYPTHNGVTNELNKLKAGAELLIRDVWGAITYQGKGVFIAGGAGITPFVAILRHLQTMREMPGNMLIFANKTRADIILEKEFRDLLGSKFINILSDEEADGYFHGMISEPFLKTHVADSNGRFYVCGPPPMMRAVLKQLANLGVAKNSITLEL
jgi:ferredoxin-NADP reductase